MTTCCRFDEIPSFLARLCLEKRRKYSDGLVREKPNTAVDVDTEEMRKWRGLSQSEMDLCWKNLVERMEEEVLNKYEVEESKKMLSEVEVLLWNGEGSAKARNTE